MKRLATRTIAAALLFASAVPSASALTFLDLATGDEGLLPDARSIAMGRTRVSEATGAFTGRSNPALLSRLEQGVVSLGGGVLKMEESRAIPAFNSFDGFLVESIYAYNDHYQWEQGFGAASVLDLNGIAVGVGASWSPVRDYQYDYTEELRDNNPFTRPRDKLIALNEVQSDGILGAFNLAAGATIHSMVDVGFGLEFLRGHQDVLMRLRLIQEEVDERSVLNANGLSGERAILGIALHPNHIVALAATWTSGVDLTGKFLRLGDMSRLSFLGAPPSSGLGAGSLEVTYPQEVRVGATYRPRARLQTTIRMDLAWTEWSEFKNPLFGVDGLDNVWDVRVGIEHVFYNGVPARFGFRFAPSPVDDEVATTAFTFGGGFDYGPLRADVAFEVANREYRFEDLVDDALIGGTTRTQLDRVEESFASAFMTLSYDLQSFGG